MERVMVARPVVLIAAVGMLITACSSGSDVTSTVPLGSTTVPLAQTTTSSAVATTTSTTVPLAQPTTSSAVATTTSILSALTVEIVEPAPLSTHLATIDLGDGRLAAPIRFAADVEIPPGETVAVLWESDVDGTLGSGSVVDTELSNDRSDVVSHRITVTVTSSSGRLGTASIDVIVRVPSN